jgi:Niemann-Pick C1 protein
VDGKWTAIVTTTIHRPILTALHAVTSKAVSNPKRTIGAVAVLSLLLFVVGLFTNFNIDVDDDTVWTPSGARPVQRSKWIHDESGFPAETRLFFLIFHSDGDNALGQDEVKRVFRAVDAVRGLEGYDTMCADSQYVNDFGDSACEMNGITAFWNDTASIFEEQVQSEGDAILALSAEYYPNGTPVSEKNIIGSPERESDGTLSSVLSYIVKMNFPDTDKAENSNPKPWI